MSSDELGKDIVSEGTGAAIKAGDTITVHCTGTIKRTGKKFWSTKDPGQKPFSFTIGQGSVIRAWDEGLLGMKNGGHVILDAPSSWAYGSGGYAAFGIGSGDDLIFDIEVLKIQYHSSPQPPTMAYNTDDLLACCAALGSLDDAHPDTYHKGDDCLYVVRDLVRYLRRDNPRTKEFHLALGQWSVMQRDLLPLLVNYANEGALAMAVLKLITMLTMPVEEEPGIEEKEKLFKNTLAYTECLQAYKEAFLKPGVLPSLLSLLLEPLSHDVANGGEGRSQKDNDLIGLVLALLRNLLIVPDPRPQAGSAGAHRVHLHDDFVDALFSYDVPDLFLALVADIASPDNEPWAMTCLEIFANLFRGRDPRQLVQAHKDGAGAAPRSPPQSQAKGGGGAETASSDPLGIQDLMVEGPRQGKGVSAPLAANMSALARTARLEAAARKMRNAHAPSRHSRFGGVFRYQAANGQHFSWNKPVTELSATGSRHDSGKRARKPPKSLPSAFPLIVGSKPRLLAALYSLGSAFLAGGYEKLMKVVTSVFAAADVLYDPHSARDKCNYFFLASFVSQLYAVSFAAFPHLFVSDECGKPTFTIAPLAVTTHTEPVLFTIKWISTFATDKYPAGQQAALRHMASQLDLLRLMITAGDAQNTAAADPVVALILYHNDLQSALVNAVVKWTPRRFSLDFLRDAIHAIHAFLKTTAAFTANKEHVYRKGRRKRKAKDKAAAEAAVAAESAAAAGAETAGAAAAAAAAAATAAQEAAEAEAEAEAAHHEHKFDFAEFVRNFARSPKVIDAYVAVLSAYEANSYETNYHVLRMFHRIAVSAQMEGAFFKVSILALLNAMVHDQAWRVKEPVLHKETVKFTKFIMASFTKRVRHDPMLYIDALINVRTSRIRDIHEIGSDAWLIQHHKMTPPPGWHAANAARGGTWTEAELKVLEDECNTAVDARAAAADRLARRRAGNDSTSHSGSASPAPHDPEALLARLVDKLPGRSPTAIKARAAKLGYKGLLSKPRGSGRSRRRRGGRAGSSGSESDDDDDGVQAMDSGSGSGSDSGAGVWDQRRAPPQVAYTPFEVDASLPTELSAGLDVLAAELVASGDSAHVREIIALLQEVNEVREATVRRGGALARDALEPQKASEVAALTHSRVQQVLGLLGLHPPVSEDVPLWAVPASMDPDTLESRLDMAGFALRKAQSLHAAVAAAAEVAAGGEGSGSRRASTRRSRKRRRSQALDDTVGRSSESDSDAEAEGDAATLPPPADAPDGVKRWSAAELGSAVADDADEATRKAALAGAMRALVASPGYAMGLCFVRAQLALYVASDTPAVRPMRKAFGWPIKPRSMAEWFYLESRELAAVMQALGLEAPVALPEDVDKLDAVGQAKAQLATFWRVPYWLRRKLRKLLATLNKLEAGALLAAAIEATDEAELAALAASYAASRKRGDDEEEDEIWTAEDLAFIAADDEVDDGDDGDDDGSYSEIGSEDGSQSGSDSGSGSESSTSDSESDSSGSSDDEAAKAALARAAQRSRELLRKRREERRQKRAAEAREARRKRTRVLSESESESDDESGVAASGFSILSQRTPLAPGLAGAGLAPMEIEGAGVPVVARMQRRVVIDDSDSDSDE
ncbi:uncharacterized protein AMSG_11601 [Thecamonas trahens ATCC 50062]|uniref:peptidylprolyl isomerase n=1 Tax=Thecamonas trahens ATCC 50062 TaxID=461836 RepID=A0A0L0D8B3_THETB|nr:hypothetical protein AMSG_11601 [Thecamonas trahens ATCC 50062]KNC48559.1 hypothetical protein AMSG_11601 [Thecamonas trahens ATCC 50062]|eukprot:XP_013762872.1 hypothetical protein AMSG_11601 [Thecamonas trahens ATCC 50062]